VRTRVRVRVRVEVRIKVSRNTFSVKRLFGQVYYRSVTICRMKRERAHRAAYTVLAVAFSKSAFN